MYKPLLIFVCGFLVMVSLSGCVGMMIFSPGECEKETPPWSTNAEYLKEWGKPDKIEPISGDRVVWIYERSIWCGVIPCWLVCAPLILPVCDGFDRVYFKGDTAKWLHTRRILGAGVLIGLIGPLTSAGADEACKTRLLPSLSQKIEPDRTVALSVAIDTPDHQQDKEYQEVARQLREFLATDLVKEDNPIFKAVVSAETRSADYAMEVTLTSATFTGLFSRQYEADMNVRITDNKTNQLIGDFEVYAESDKSTVDKSGLESVVQNAVEEIRGAIVRYDDSSQSPEILKPNEDLPPPPGTGATAAPSLP